MAKATSKTPCQARNFRETAVTRHAASAPATRQANRIDRAAACPKRVRKLELVPAIAGDMALYLLCEPGVQGRLS
jgi:hypothetical protein